MALSANTTMARVAGEQKASYKVAGGVHIYSGAYLGRTPAGYVRPLIAGDAFVGVANGEFNNTSDTDGAVSASGDLGEVYAGQQYCDAWISGDVIGAISGVSIASIGKPAYATADDTLALTGHPDSFVGYIVALEPSVTNGARVRMKFPGEMPPNDGSSILIDIDFARVQVNALDETLDGVVANNLFLDAVGAGLTAGTTGLLYDTETGEARLLIDNDNEAENLTLRTPMTFNVTKGITFLIEGRLKTAGGAATDDLDFGLASLSGGLTDTERANMDAATSGLKSAKFHLDSNGNDVYFSSDDDSAPVAAVDTTINNSLTANKVWLIHIPPTGAAQVWVDGVRVLSSTTFSVSTSGKFCGFVNLEKSTGTGVPEARIKRIRVAGAIA